MDKCLWPIEIKEALKLQTTQFVYITPSDSGIKIPAIVMANNGSTIRFCYFEGGNVTGTTEENINELGATWYLYKEITAIADTPDGTLFAIPVQDKLYPGIEIRLLQHGDDIQYGSTLLTLTEYTSGGEIIDENEFPDDIQLHQENLKRTVPVTGNETLRRTTPGFTTRSWTDKNLHHKHVKTLHRGYKLTANLYVDFHELEHVIKTGTHPEIIGQNVTFDGRGQHARVTYIRENDNTVSLLAVLKDMNDEELTSRKYQNGLNVKSIDLRHKNVHYVINIKPN